MIRLFCGTGHGSSTGYGSTSDHADENWIILGIYSGHGSPNNATTNSFGSGSGAGTTNACGSPGDNCLDVGYGIGDGSGDGSGYANGGGDGKW